jgi:CMP-N-acetylneuraminic acid synthetase
MKNGLTDIPVIILARSGSKRLRDKNILILGNKTLSQWSCENGLRISNRVIYSSDSQRYLSMLNDGRVELHKRSEQNASDKSTSLDALREVVYSLDISHDHIILLQPTNPVIDFNLVKEIISRRIKGKSTIACGRLDKNVIENTIGGVRIHEKNSLLFESGMFYLISTARMKEGLLYGENDLFLESEHAGHTIDIDNQKDMDKAKLYLDDKH